jgi:diguanylate cyclase (GGDEF)-like protein
MERKERTINVYIAVLLPFGLGAVLWALIGLPYETVGFGMVALALVTIFLSSSLRIQLPRHNVHLTISDALIISTLVVFGGEVAVLLAVAETAYTSFMFRRAGVAIKTRTILMNILIAAIAVFASTLVVNTIVGEEGALAVASDIPQFAVLLIAIAVTLFVINTLCVTPFLAMKHERPLASVLSEYWSDSLMVYMLGALMAGCIIVTLQQVNIYFSVTVTLLFGLIYWTYRRNINEVRETASAVRDSEKLRAEQAEQHVGELEHYVTELEKSAEALTFSREQFRHAALHDKLTGLPNRNSIIGRITDLIGTRGKFAVMFLDLDRFRTVNDSLGHSIGDHLIVQVGSRLTEMIGDHGTVGRFSGDEFAILVEGTDTLTHANGLAAMIVSQIAKPFDIEGRQIFTSVSIGIARGPGNYTRAEEVLRDADIAMYYAKDGSKGFVEFDNDMHEQAVRLHQLETDLRAGIARREFEVFYQPIVDLADAGLSGFEALVRWRHPTRGLISPKEFIPVAESTGLIIPMTEQILADSCSQIVEWQTARKSPLTMSVNLSARHFALTDLVDRVDSVLDASQLDPGSLKLEITESAVMENAEAAISILHKIKRSGVKISIDDFGTGYSSLSYLQRFPIDTLKVDRSFISVMDEKDENGAIVRTVVALAKALQLNVVAEGVETPDQFHRLRGLGCEYGQGYLFSRPLAKNAIEELLDDQHRWKGMLSGAPLVQIEDMVTIDQSLVVQ